MADGSQRPGSGTRFTFIDGLRGLAALAVLVYHFYNQVIEPGHRPELIEPLHTLVRHGHLGVEIFFVLSGFVIAFSIHGAYVTPGYLGNFALRRSLRLDPPYWVVIFLTYAVIRVAGSLGESSARMPGVPGVLANMFYLDNLLGVTSIVKVGWTLCLEVQFYLVFIVLVALTQRLASIAARPLARLATFGPLAAYALALQVGWLPLPHPGLFVEYWAMFFLGALTWWTYAGEARPRTWMAFAAITLIVAIAGRDVRLGVALATAAAIHLAGRRDQLTRLLDGRLLQYLGRISYSLYLVHPLVGHKTIRILSKRFPFEGALGAVALFVIALGAAVVAAHLLHVFVERPTVRFSRRFRRTTRPIAA